MVIKHRNSLTILYTLQKHLDKNIENETANLTRNADLAIDFLKEDTNLPKEGSFSTTL